MYQVFVAQPPGDLHCFPFVECLRSVFRSHSTRPRGNWLIRSIKDAENSDAFKFDNGAA
jgi:hypothetical protein